MAGAKRVAIFEVGRVFIPPEAKEERHLGILLWGNTASLLHWRCENRALDYFDLKGVIESLSIPTSFKRVQRPDLMLAAEIWSNNQRIGLVGQIPSERRLTIGPTSPVLFAELNVDLIAHAQTASSFREVAKFPSVTRDIAMIVPEKLSHAEIFSTIASVNEPLLASIELFDVFSGKEEQNFGAGKKSLA
jgi:phenylalanyl-tRNA synthetase beta chain